MSRQPTKRFSVEEAVAQIFGHDEEGTEIEQEIEEDVSEVKGNTDFDPYFEENDKSTDGEGEAPEKQTRGDIPVQEWTLALVFNSQDRCNRARVENIITMFGDTLREIYLQADIGLLDFRRAYCSNNEATKSLWDA